MKEAKRRRSLSGAVLIMILTVMFILIILLTATLTTVTTANQRIYTKFEENQAYYSARSALDVFQNMLIDGNYVSDIDYTYTKADGSSDTVKMKQGLGLQMDIYCLTAQESVQNVKQSELASFVGTTSNTDLQKVEYNDWYGTDSSKVKTDASGNEYIEYEVELPQLANGGSKYGKMSDKDSGVKIKVELIERTYDIGSYDISSYADKNDFFENASDAEKAEAVISGDRKKDKLSVKITATTAFDGVAGIAASIFKSSEPGEPPAGTNAITVLGVAYDLVDITVIGGFSSPVNTHAQDAIEIGDAFIGENLDVSDGNGSEFLFNNSECLFVAGDIEYQNNVTFRANEDPSNLNTANRDKRPFAYIGGDFTIGANLSGLKSYGVDLVIAGDLTVTGDGTLSDFNGDIFVNGTIDLSGAGDHTQVVNGTVYTPNTIIYNGGDSGSVPFSSVSTSSFSVSAGQLTLPDGSSRTLPTKAGIYSEYYEGGDFDDPDKVFTAEDLAFLSKEDRDNGMHTTDTFKDLADGLGNVNILRNSNGNWYYGDWTPRPDNNLTAGDYYCPDGVSNNWCNLNVTGGGTVRLILGSNPSWGATYSGKITVDDDTQLVICSYDNNLTYNFQNFSVVNKKIQERLDNGQPLYVGHYGDEFIPPNVFMYFSRGCHMVDDGSGDFFTACIYAPEASVELRQAHTVNSVIYDNVPIGTKNVNVFGLVTSAYLTTMNQAGVSLGGLSGGGSWTPGEPLHHYEAFWRIRS